jgi:hypothetical protein
MEKLAKEIKKDVVSLFQAQSEYQYIVKQTSAKERIKEFPKKSLLPTWA